MYPRILTILLLSYHAVVPKCSYISGLLFLQGVIIHFIARLRCKGEGETWKFRQGPPSLRFLYCVWLRLNRKMRKPGGLRTALQMQALWAAEKGL